MRINKKSISSKDWKTKVILGYVLIIALFCIATSWILFVTVPDAIQHIHEADTAASAALMSSGTDHATASSMEAGEGAANQSDEGSQDSLSALLAPIQVFGFGLLLAVLLIASLLSYWSYGAALNSVERTERALTSFMGNSSHEMKTPVASIKLLSESIVIAANRGQIEYVKDFAQRIEQESDHLEKLVRDMLNITRTSAPLKVHSANVGSDKIEEFSIKAIVDEALLTQEPMLQKKELKLSVHFDDKVDGLLPDITEQDFLTIVNNLVGNAVAYTDSGTITVEVRAMKDALMLRVGDTGCGIARHDQDRVFERFYRVDSTRTSYAQGTGLGLPLVSSIVANAGGKITLKSELGQGSTFTVVLPVRGRRGELGQTILNPKSS
jgi:signal transduction histidine kinase